MILSVHGAPVEKSLPEGAMCYCESPLPTRTIFFCFISKKYHYGSLGVGLPVLKTPLSMVSPKPLDNHYIQICQLEKDTQKGQKSIFFVCSLHSEADKEHSMDHSRPCVAGGRVFSVILVCHDLGRGCGMLLFLLLLGWLAVCCRGAPP